MDSMNSMSSMDGGVSTTSSSIVNQNMNVGTYNVEDFPTLYWIVIGSSVAAFAAINAIHYVLYRQRMAANNAARRSPARPRSLFWRIYATITAIFRESCNASLPALRIGRVVFHLPTLGSLFIVLANATFLIILCFYALDTTNVFEYQNIGYRTGYVSLAQIPFIFVLAGKNNIVGWLTGSSYERLSWIHRWFARTLLLTVTLHMAYWLINWAPFSYISAMMLTDATTRKGLAAWCILVWIVFSSFAPIRRISYEFFVFQHLVSYVAFTTMVFLHTPSSDHIWIWAAVAFYFFDRATRFLHNIYLNVSLFGHQQQGEKGRLWSSYAEFLPLACNVTKVTIRNTSITWRPGQHVRLSCHSLLPLQTHPFTISSLPSDGKIEFIIKAHNGGTKHFYKHSESCLELPKSEEMKLPITTPVTIEGPYGNVRPLRQFHSVVLLAGSTGATFTVPLLRDIVTQWQAEPIHNKQGFLCSLAVPAGAVTRHIRFVWAIKSRAMFSWFSTELNEVMQETQRLQRLGRDVSVSMSVYVTCDDTVTADWCDSGVVETMQPELIDSETDLLASDDEKEVLEVHEIDAQSDQTPLETRGYDKVKTCQPDGTCCCQTTVCEDDEKDAQISACHCMCAHNPEFVDSSASSAKDFTTLSSENSRLHNHKLHPSINLLSGRPHPRTIIQKVLEHADGETAVVCCGPRSLNEEVRRNVVGLSDERAVHKGTGAQGIWFHSEGFGY